MALKASGAYRQCAPCAAQTAPHQRRNGSYGGGDSDSERFRWSNRRAGSSGSNSSSAAGRRQLEARLKGISSGEGTPASASGRRVDPVVFVEESEPKEWVAQVEPGVLITFLSLPRGGNDLKQIKFRYSFGNFSRFGGVLIGWGKLIIVFCMLFNELMPIQFLFGFVLF